MRLTEARRIGYLFEESNGILTEGILDRIKDSIKKKFSKKETEDIKQNLSDNLDIDENSSIDEIEEKLREKTGGKDNFGLLKKVIKEVAGFGAMSLTWEIQAMIGAGIIKFFDYSPIAIAAVVIYTIYTISDDWEKIRRKVLGKKVDQFIFGKRGHLGDYDGEKNKDGDDKEMNENKKVVRLTESDLARIVKRVIEEGGYQGIKNDLEYHTGIYNFTDTIIGGITKVGGAIMRLVSIARGDSNFYNKIGISEKILKKSITTFTKLKKLKKLISLFEERGMKISKSDLIDYGFDIEDLLNDLEKRYNEITEYKNLVDDQDLMIDLEEYEKTLNEVVDLLYEIPD